MNSPINRWTTEELKTLMEMRANRNTAADIAKALNRSLDSVRHRLKRFRTDGIVLQQAPTPAPIVDKLVKHEVELPKKEFGRLPLPSIDTGEWLRFGLVADTHLCCKEERLAELHTQYDLFEKEGIEKVFHAGNPIDGYIQRINGESVFANTIDGQADYFAMNYPQRKGLRTYFITGDDHESWFAPGFNIGAYMQVVAEKAGRTDLQYIGHVEADAEVWAKGAKAPTIIKIMHPGGGSAYARSYSPQKVIESFEGGEKPNILVLGHWHVSDYFQDRNIHVISLPGFQDQTIFARKKRLRMEVGGAILEFKVNPEDGTVTRCRVEITRYFTRGYYKRFIKSDKKLVAGRLVFKSR